MERNAAVICLDTNAWYWFLTDDARLPRLVRREIDRQEVAVSSVSLWEIALFAEIERIRLRTDVRTFLEGAVTAEGIQLVALTPAICVRAARLGPLFPKDPADRLITSTAIELGVRLATADQAITTSGVVPILWD